MNEKTSKMLKVMDSVLVKLEDAKHTRKFTRKIRIY